MPTLLQVEDNVPIAMSMGPVAAIGLEQPPAVRPHNARARTLSSEPATSVTSCALLRVAQVAALDGLELEPLVDDVGSVDQCGSEGDVHHQWLEPRPEAASVATAERP